MINKNKVSSIRIRDDYWLVPSTDGKSYYKVKFNKDGAKCSCKGFAYYRKCKHIFIAAKDRHKWLTGGKNED